jgi:hypothetical protein
MTPSGRGPRRSDSSKGTQGSGFRIEHEVSKSHILWAMPFDGANDVFDLKFRTGEGVVKLSEGESSCQVCAGHVRILVNCHLNLSTTLSDPELDSDARNRCHTIVIAAQVTAKP